MRKHVTSVRLVLLSQMTREDWGVLDYDVLRPSARVTIDQAILDGELAGFYQVDVDMHKASRPHGGKERYFFPAYRGAVAKGEVPDTSDFQTYETFDAKTDQDLVDTRPSETLGYLLFVIKMLSPEAQTQMMKMINAELPEGYEEVDTEAMSLLESRDQALLVAAMLFLMNKPARAKAILKAVEIQDDEIYAMFNDNEPLD